MGTLDNRVQDWRAKRSGDAGPQPARQWSACAHFAKVFCLIGTFAQITPPARPGHLIGSVSGDRLGKRPWALKENLCHGPSKNIPLWAFLVPYINHSKHSKLFKNVGGKNQTKAAYSKIMVGCSCCSNCTNQPFQVSLLRIAAAAMDSTVKVPPQTWNLGKCIVVPLERCWKIHKKEERSLESRLWNLWNPATMLFYHELSRSQWPPVSWHFFKMPPGQGLGLGVFVRNVPSVARNGENPDIDRAGSIQDYAETLKDVKSKKVSAKSEAEKWNAPSSRAAPSLETMALPPSFELRVSWVHLRCSSDKWDAAESNPRTDPGPT